MERNRKLYQDFYKAYTSAHPEKTGTAAQNDANELWKNTIKEGKKEINMEVFEAEMLKLKEKQKKRPHGIMSFLKKKKSSSENPVELPAAQLQNQSDVFSSDNNQEEDVIELNDTEDSTSVESLNLKRNYPKPAQEKLKIDIVKADSVLLGLIETKNLGLAGPGGEKSINDQIKQVKSHKEQMERKLKRNEDLAKAQQKNRDKKKAEIEKVKEDFPEIAASRSARSSVGRPRIECDQPGLLEDILKIAVIGAAPCADRRREDIFRTVKTLDDLHTEITKLGYIVSRSALYLRLIPRDRTTVSGKLHVVTVPVKLLRPQNNLRKGHPDRMFAAESCKAVDEIAAYLGPDCVVYLSQDDKSSVPLGIVAAKKQSTILMSLQYRIRLPDHDFRVGSKHLLTPSVLAVCVISPNGGVTYSGPTYVGVRSAKHNGSTAFSHCEDLGRLIELEPELFHIPGSVNEMKPVIVKGVDGGPDENPRYANNINMGCNVLFKYGLDGYIEVTNAPGLSAYNRAERRMHPFSKQMTGLVLPYETFGSHLDGNGKTIDVELEKKNFDAAGEILAEVFGDCVIDGFPVHSEYIKTPVDDSIKGFVATPLYRARHVLETQYMTVYMKCDDKDCCSEPRTSFKMFFPNQTIPPLIPVKLTAYGPQPLERSKNLHKADIKFPNVSSRIISQEYLLTEDIKEEFSNHVPYDAFMPSLGDKIQKRICKNCFKYHASVKSLTLHKKICKKGKKGINKGPKRGKRKGLKPSADYTDESDSEDEQEPIGIDDDDSFEEESDQDEVGEEDSATDSSEDTEVLEEPGRTVSVSYSDTFDKIIDLKQWMMSPWAPDIQN